MLMGADAYEGEGVHIYRSLSEIRRDIANVREEIVEINSVLNIRNMLIDMLSDEARAEPSEWLPELCELVLGAEEGLRELSLLKSTLEQLREELEYTRAALYGN